MQPWEMMDAVAALPAPLSDELLARIRNRRLAYEREIQLKAGQAAVGEPAREPDYY